MKPVPRPKLQYGNTSRSFTTANGATRALAMWLLLCLHRISANNNRLLETGVSTIARTPHVQSSSSRREEDLWCLSVLGLRQRLLHLCDPIGNGSHRHRGTR